MPLMPCEKSVRCPGTDSPVENYSSEAPDNLRFIGISFAPPDKHHWHDPNGFSSTGCLGICYSVVSQEDADLCAALQAYLCDDSCDPIDPDCTYTCPGDPRCSCTVDNDDPTCPFHCPGDPRCPDDCINPDDPSCLDYNCPGDPRCPTPVIYYSQEQVCVAVCADGSSFTWVVPARQFAADSQLLADRMAASYCRKQAALHRVCLSNIPPTATEGVPYKNTNGSTVRIIASGSTVVNGRDTWTLVQGTVPPGLTLHLNQEVNRSIALDGTPTSSGAYSFTVKVQTPSGDYMVKTYTITVAETITDMPLDQAVYVPSVGGRPAYIAGVYGGYLYTFDPATGAASATLKSRISVPPFSDSSLAYNPADDRLYLAHWNDPASGTPLLTDATGQRLYQINADTLAVITTWDLNVLDPGPLGHWLYWCGMHRIICNAGKIYGTYFVRGSGFRPHGFVFSFDPATATFVSTVTNNTLGGWLGLAINGSQLWLAAADTKKVYTMALADITNGGTIAPSYTTGAPANFDLCVVPSGNAYLTTKTGVIRRLTSGGSDRGNLTLPGASPYVLCVRYNPFNGLVYAPDVNNNSVNVINPADDSVTVKTGFDSPLDMVFTPTKIFAVQSGRTALKEVV